MNSEVLIIGGGPAGIEAALTASRYTNNVTLVTKENVGEWKAGYTNIFLSNIDDIRQQRSFSLPLVHNIYNDWGEQQTRKVQESGMQILYGEPSFQSTNLVKVVQSDGMEEFISSKKIIIANGSRPIFPKSIQPDGEKIFSYQNIMKMEQLPATIIIIGDGPIGYEMVNLFLQLNVDVTWLLPENPNQLLDKEIFDYMHSYYTKKGVKIERGPWVKELKNCGDQVKAIREDNEVFKAEAAFITLGFRSNIDQLHIELANLKLNRYGTVDSNEYGQTENESIYIAGDAQAPHSFTAVQAMTMARIATLHALNLQPESVEISSLPLSFNENPQIATVGYVNTDDKEVNYKKVPYQNRNFRSFMSNQREGFIKIVWNKDGVIIGGTCVGYQAKDIITTIELMIKMRTTIDQAQSFFGSHPSVTELPFIALRES
ncbi:FAD-dependent oxidoreductase [Lentibacillus sediminis]|uniref:FAD-dependent oxidoreductase n=1 Tax=Lentibacillus sediminis TaxID=1940529 RepID=UPI000C1B8AD0|nr:FAD-dependent oxidoreductase [Lentibacillus sediminis]